MKIYFSFIILVLLNINFCQENTTETVPEKKEVNPELIKYLESLKDLKIIDREQLREIFVNIFDLLIEDPVELNNQTNIQQLHKFADDIFDKIADKEKNVIIFDEAIQKLDYSIIKNYISEFFKSFDLEAFLKSFFKAIIQLLGDLFVNAFKNSDL